MDKLIGSLTGLSTSSGLLLGQLVFSVFFVGSCEVPNFLSKAPATNACLERWMTVSALFFPSGVGASKSVATDLGETVRTTRRRLFQ